MPIIANQIVYCSQLAVHDPVCSVAPVRGETFSMKQTTKILFPQHLDSKWDISVSALLKQIVLFTLMQNINKIISQSKHHYCWIAHCSPADLFYYCIFFLVLHLELIWTSRTPGAGRGEGNGLLFTSITCNTVAFFSLHRILSRISIWTALNRWHNPLLHFTGGGAAVAGGRRVEGGTLTGNLSGLKQGN